MSDEHSLREGSTYLKTWGFSVSLIRNNYQHLVSEYFMFILSNQEQLVIRNLQIFKFLVIRGLETITHIFKNILIYTNNLDAALFHAQRGICLYVEFITQITQNSNAFIKLSSKDAVQYVYKKTIFCLKDRTTDTLRNTQIDDVNDVIDNIKTKISLYVQKEIKTSNIEMVDVIMIGDMMNVLKICYTPTK